MHFKRLGTNLKFGVINFNNKNRHFDGADLLYNGICNSIKPGLFWSFPA